jgi:hypothetical protein
MVPTIERWIRFWEWNWDLIFERIADIPWGVVLIAIVIVKVNGTVPAEEIRALATAGGLLGIGHGIHTGSKHFAKRSGR